MAQNSKTDKIWIPLGVIPLVAAIGMYIIDSRTIANGSVEHNIKQDAIIDENYRKQEMAIENIKKEQKEINKNQEYENKSLRENYNSLMIRFVTMQNDIKYIRKYIERQENKK